MVSPPINFADYSTVLFIDTMVALEAKLLAVLPWHEIDPTGPILVLTVPQVNSEIDKRKRDGRLGKRAREFNRLIGPAAESTSAVRVCDGPPPVDIAIAICDRVNWDAIDDLDPELGDARIVAQILHARGVPLERRVLFSHDTNAIAMAARRGLKVKRLPDHWHQEPEPSPQEKELAKLKARVIELQATEPDLEVSLSFGIGSGLRLYEVSPLSKEQQTSLIQLVLAANPKADHRGSIATFGFDYDSSFDQRYEHYRNVIVPKYASIVHELLEVHYCQIPFRIRLQNTGHVPAENLIVRMDAVGGTIGKRFRCYAIFGPAAPVPKPYDPLSHVRNMDFPLIQQPVGRHDMYFAIGPGRGTSIEVHCADFRHGKIWEFEGTAAIDPRSKGPFKVLIEVTASNLHGTIKQIAEFVWTSHKVEPGDLVDFGTRGYHVKIPMAVEFEQAIERQDGRWFDFVEDEVEDEYDD